MVLVYSAAPVAGILMLFFILTELIGGGVHRLPSEAFEDEIP
jgi:TRAP-type C4-dicarboxylate transport system permease small subunit